MDDMQIPTLPLSHTACCYLSLTLSLPQSSSSSNLSGLHTFLLVIDAEENILKYFIRWVGLPGRERLPMACSGDHDAVVVGRVRRARLG